MAIRVPAIMQVKQILRRSVLSSKEATFTAKKVPKGYFAVYVGEEQKKRFILPISYLNEPSFQKLLSKVEDEFGFDHPMGGLTIPYGEDVFMDLTSRLNGSSFITLRSISRDRFMDSSTYMPPFRGKLDGMHVYTHLRTALLYLKNISIICHGLFNQAEADVDGSTWKHTKEVLHGSNFIQWVVLTEPHAENPSVINLCFGYLRREMKDMILSIENMNFSTFLTQKSVCSILKSIRLFHNSL